ncbi:MAG: arylesterase [Bryobacteraceae bacterium]
MAFISIFARAAPVVLVSFALASCGGESTKAPAKPEAERKPASSLNPNPGAALPPAEPNDHRKLFIAFGDSLTAGYGVEPGKSYPDDLQKLIDADQPGTWRILNAGISGETTSGGLNRVDSIVSQKPAVVLLELGGNDGLRGVPLSSTRGNMEAMIQALLASGAKVMLAGMTLPPNYGPDYIHEFEGIYKDLAAKYKLPLIPFLLVNVATVPGLMQGDGIHPTAAGQAIVAKTVYRFAKPLLR